MKALMDLSLEDEDKVTSWTGLEIVQQSHVLDEMSKVEILVSELEFNIVTREMVYNKQLAELLQSIRATIFLTSSTPLFSKRQFSLIVARLKKYSDRMRHDFEKDWLNEKSIALQLERVSDTVYYNMSAGVEVSLISYCEVLSELRNTLRQSPEEGSGRMEDALVPLRRLVWLKSCLTKISDNVGSKERLMRVCRALDAVSRVLEKCYEVLISLHNFDYVADIENILDMSCKVSSIKYKWRKAYAKGPKRFQVEVERHPETPSRRGRVQPDPAGWTTCPSSIASPVLDRLFLEAPLFQALHGHQEEKEQANEDNSNEDNFYEEIGLHSGTLWCQLDSVVADGLMDGLKTEERALQEAKFEIITSEVSYFKSISIFINLLESVLLSQLIGKNMKSQLLSYIVVVKQKSESFLSSMATLLSQDHMMKSIHSQVQTYIFSLFDVYVNYCAQERILSSSFHWLMKSSDEFVKQVEEIEGTECQGNSLCSYFSLPFQRISRLGTLLERILRGIRQDQEYIQAEAALVSLKQLERECSKREAAPSISTNVFTKENIQSKFLGINLLNHQCLPKDEIVTAETYHI